MKAALLLIDLQRDYLDGDLHLQPTAGALVRRAADLLDAFRRCPLPIIHVWTTLRPGEPHRFPHWPADPPPRCVAGSVGHQPPAPLHPLPNEGTVQKRGYNPFTDGDLAAQLEQLAPDVVVLAGVHLHACVRTAAVECLERGYRLIIAEDAVGTNDPVHGAAVQRWLSDRGVQFQSVAALLTRLTGSSDDRLVQRSPRDADEVLFAVRPADPTALAAAVDTAVSHRRAWAATTVKSRVNRLGRLAAALRSEAATLARQMAIEIGKPLTQGLEEVQRAAANVEDVARRITLQSADPAAPAWVRTRPLGVIALISPWNNPVAIPVGKIAPALAHGNTVVWKPAPAGTQLARVTLTLIRAAGFPEGVVQVVEGDGATARQLAGHPHVDAVTFTGSSQAGYAIQEICAARCRPLQAELGGNNAAIFWLESDLPAAAAQVAWGAFGFAGQRCTANRRIIVPGDRCAVVFRALEEAAAALTWGDPLDPTTVIGPVLTASRRDDLAALVTDAMAAGALDLVSRPHLTRAAPRPPAQGAYAPPTLVVCRDPWHPLVQEESMAPLLVVQPARDFDHALTLCNGVRQGLAAALFSRSPEHQQRFLECAQAGILKLNSSTAGVDPALPFGGWKASGLGPPEHGEGDALFYSRLQAVYTAAAVTPPRPPTP